MWALLSTLALQFELHAMSPNHRASIVRSVLAASCSAYQRLSLMTTFYPFRPLCCREPDSMFAMWRTEKHLGGQPHLIGGATCDTRPLCRAARTKSDQTMAI